MKTWPGDKVLEGATPSQWDRCYRRLKKEVLIRQYSRKTLQTYRSWIQQFEPFLKSKDPASVDSDKVVRAKQTKYFPVVLSRANFDIRTIQQLLGHSDVRTTIIYTHTVESRTIEEVTSPLDFPASE